MKTNKRHRRAIVRLARHHFRLTGNHTISSVIYKIYKTPHCRLYQRYVWHWQCFVTRRSEQRIACRFGKGLRYQHHWQGWVRQVKKRIVVKEYENRLLRVAVVARGFTVSRRAFSVWRGWRSRRRELRNVISYHKKFFAVRVWRRRISTSILNRLSRYRGDLRHSAKLQLDYFNFWKLYRRKRYIQRYETTLRALEQDDRIRVVASKLFEHWKRRFYKVKRNVARGAAKCTRLLAKVSLKDAWTRVWENWMTRKSADILLHEVLAEEYCNTAKGAVSAIVAELSVIEAIEEAILECDVSVDSVEGLIRNQSVLKDLIPTNDITCCNTEYGCDIAPLAKIKPEVQLSRNMQVAVSCIERVVCTLFMRNAFTVWRSLDNEGSAVVATTAATYDNEQNTINFDESDLHMTLSSPEAVRKPAVLSLVTDDDESKLESKTIRRICTSDSPDIMPTVRPKSTSRYIHSVLNISAVSPIAPPKRRHVGYLTVDRATYKPPDQARYLDRYLKTMETLSSTVISKNLFH